MIFPTVNDKSLILIVDLCLEFCCKKNPHCISSNWMQLMLMNIHTTIMRFKLRKCARKNDRWGNIKKKVSVMLYYRLFRVRLFLYQSTKQFILHQIYTRVNPLRCGLLI